MRISVIIATRDRTAFLADALASVRGQTRPADEIIVVDDATTDTGAADVCRRFPGVVYLRSGGKGLAAARNIGNGTATGDIIVVQDDDDVMMPARIANHVSAFAGNAQVTCGAWVNVTTRTHDALLRLVPGHSVPTLEGLLLGGACLNHGAAAYRTALLRKHHYDESLHAGSDMDLHARLLADRAVFRHTETVVLIRRLHAESVTQRHGDAQKSVKDGLRSRFLARAETDDIAVSYATPSLVRPDFERALDLLGIDGAMSRLGASAKTLAAVAALSPRASSTAILATIGHGGFVEVVVPIAAPHLGAIEAIAGVAPLKSPAMVQDANAAEPDPVASLGLTDGGGRILVDIDGLDMVALAALNAAVASVSPSWRFVSGHPVLATAFESAPRLAIVSNRYTSQTALARALQGAAYAVGRLRLPRSSLGVAALVGSGLVGTRA